MLIRLLDILFASLGLILGLPVLVLLWSIGRWDTGSPLFRQQRVGRNQQSFVLVKFRTMRLDTTSIATDLADASAVTPFGRFLRHTKRDELPQLWNVLKGEMGMVGPRPCLFNQEELIAQREARGVFKVRPGITGLAQVRGIDMSTPSLLVEIDVQMIQNLTLFHYFRYILLTVLGSGVGDQVNGCGEKR